MAKGGNVEPAVGQYAEPSVCGSSDAAGASEAEQHNRAHRPDSQRHRVRLRVHPRSTRSRLGVAPNAYAATEMTQTDRQGNFRAQIVYQSVDQQHGTCIP